MNTNTLGKYAKFEESLYFTNKEWVGLSSLISNFKPTNLLEEKKNFLEQRKDPQFIYSLPSRNSISDKLEVIRKLKAPTGIMEEEYSILNESEILKLEHILSRGKKGSGLRVSEQSWGKVDRETVQEAHDILQQNNGQEEKKVLSIDEANSQIMESLEELAYTEWKLEPHSNPGYSVNRSTMTIKYPDWGRRFSQKDIARLIAHEIHTHVLRAENGKLQNLMIFKKGFHKNIITEEGLAVSSESSQKVLSIYDLKKYAFRAIAADAASDLEAQFADVFNLLVELGADEDLSWNTTYRAFRGGRMIKDHIYLQGYLDVQKLSKEEIRSLYYGKIGIDQLQMLPQYKEAGFINEEYLLPKHLQ